MYLVDTNVWLERLLDQERSDEVGAFLEAVPSGQLFLTDFTFHSIGLVLCRLECAPAFLAFVQDVLVDGAVRLLRLDAEDMRRLARAAEQFRLDFDDAYQYVAAEKNDLVIVTLDDDFDRTGRGRRTPSQVLDG